MNRDLSLIAIAQVAEDISLIRHAAPEAVIDRLRSHAVGLVDIGLKDSEPETELLNLFLRTFLPENRIEEATERIREIRRNLAALAAQFHEYRPKRY